MNVARLWLAIIGAPLIWLVYLQTAYALVPWSCRGGRDGWIGALTAAALLAALGCCAIAWQSLRRERSTSDSAQRASFMALAGLGISALFALLLLASAIPLSLLDSCR